MDGAGTRTYTLQAREAAAGDEIGFAMLAWRSTITVLYVPFGASGAGP